MKLNRADTRLLITGITALIILVALVIRSCAIDTNNQSVHITKTSTYSISNFVGRKQGAINYGFHFSGGPTIPSEIVGKMTISSCSKNEEPLKIEHSLSIGSPDIDPYTGLATRRYEDSLSNQTIAAILDLKPGAGVSIDYKVSVVSKQGTVLQQAITHYSECSSGKSYYNSPIIT